MFGFNKRRYKKRLNALTKIIHKAVKQYEKVNGGISYELLKIKIDSFVYHNLAEAYSLSWGSVGFFHESNNNLFEVVGSAIKESNPFIHGAERKAIRATLLDLGIHSPQLEQTVTEQFRRSVGSPIEGESILTLADENALNPFQSVNCTLMHTYTLEDNLSSLVKLHDRFWKNRSGSLWITQSTSPEKITEELLKVGVKKEQIRVFNEESSLKITDKYFGEHLREPVGFHLLMNVLDWMEHPNENLRWKAYLDKTLGKRYDVMSAISPYIMDSKLQLNPLLPELTLKNVLKHQDINRTELVAAMDYLTQEAAYGLELPSAEALQEWADILAPIFKLKEKLTPYFDKDGINIVEGVSRSSEAFVAERHSGRAFDAFKKGYHGDNYLVERGTDDEYHHIICFKDSDIQKAMSVIFCDHIDMYPEYGLGVRAPMFIEQDVSEPNFGFTVRPSSPYVDVFNYNLFFTNKTGMEIEEARKALIYALTNSEHAVVKDLEARATVDEIILGKDGLGGMQRSVIVLDAV
ncbi:hypothetical protein [Vibrio crassostreae]|uniref:hypothetical protein n=1 Tax=Vibrio crassostreae TaxID=246167 RepID=UPI001B314A36|nr:hypothetical protein [Vibrio crassostreae]